MTTSVSQDSKNLCMLVWIGTIFFSFIPSLLLYLLYKENSYTLSQSKEALNWSITVMFCYLAAGILAILLIGMLLFPIIALVNLVFCIMGIIACSNGDDFMCPFVLRLIK